MAETKSSSGGGGVGIGGLLFVLFVGLKLTGYIDWSWWWVTAPLWGVFAIAAAVMLVPLAFLALSALIDAIVGAGRKKRTGK